MTGKKIGTLGLTCEWDKTKGTAYIRDSRNEKVAELTGLTQENKTFFGLLSGAKPDDYIGQATSTLGSGTYEAGISAVSKNAIVCKVPSLGISALGPKPP